MRYLLGVLAMALMLPPAATGQSVGATTGAINGKVIDSSDRPRLDSRRRSCRRESFALARKWSGRRWSGRRFSSRRWWSRARSVNDGISYFAAPRPRS